MKSTLPSLVVVVAGISENEDPPEFLRETALPREARKLEDPPEFLRETALPREARKFEDPSEFL